MEDIYQKLIEDGHLQKECYDVYRKHKNKMRMWRAKDLTNEDFEEFHNAQDNMFRARIDHGDYREWINDGYFTEEMVERFFELYTKLPRSFRRGYEIITRREMGEFTSLQGKILNSRIEAGDERAKKQLSEYKYKHDLMTATQDLQHLGFL